MPPRRQGNKRKRGGGVAQGGRGKGGKGSSGGAQPEESEGEETPAKKLTTRLAKKADPADATESVAESPTADPGAGEAKPAAAAPVRVTRQTRAARTEASSAAEEPAKPVAASKPAAPVVAAAAVPDEAPQAAIPKPIKLSKPSVAKEPGEQ